MGHCRGLPLPPDHDSAAGGLDEEGDGREEEKKGPDPAKEILAAIGADNAGKYLVASQVQCNYCFVVGRGEVLVHLVCRSHRGGFGRCFCVLFWRCAPVLGVEGPALYLVVVFVVTLLVPLES